MSIHSHQMGITVTAAFLASSILPCAADVSLSIVAEPDGHELVLGEVLELTFSISNTANEPQRILAQPQYFSIDIAPEDGDFRKVRFFSKGTAADVGPTILEPKESRTFSRRLLLTWPNANQEVKSSELVFPNAGDYRLRIVYDGPRKDISSESPSVMIPVRVKKPIGRNAEAWLLFNNPVVLKYVDLAWLEDFRGKLSQDDKVQLKSNVDRLLTEYPDTIYASIIKKAQAIESSEAKSTPPDPGLQILNEALAEIEQRGYDLGQIIKDHPEEFKKEVAQFRDHIVGELAHGRMTWEEYNRQLAQKYVEFVERFGQPVKKSPDTNG